MLRATVDAVNRAADAGVPDAWCAKSGRPKPAPQPARLPSASSVLLFPSRWPASPGPPPRPLLSRWVVRPL
eukprot:2548135-Prymnesium_polylepis.1